MMRTLMAALAVVGRRTSRDRMRMVIPHRQDARSSEKIASVNGQKTYPDGIRNSARWAT